MVTPAPGNIFTEQQEMDLGNALAEQFERDFHVIQNDSPNAYLQALGEKVVRQMPPTSLHFRFRLVELPVVNAFTLPGGRIYVTRRLALFARSEDELAGVLSHELGHAITHQPAANISAVFHQVLGVTSLGDRADVLAKYNQVIENVGRRRPARRSDSEQEQLIADQAAVYAMARAGYSPAAFESFWNRFADPSGKSGSWLSELFGTTKPAEKRMREVRRYIAAIPASCIAPAVADNQRAFSLWQSRILQYSSTDQTFESLPGLLWKRALHPPLESDLFEVRFSPDGNYLLAQDEGSIYVLSRQPLAPLFRIDSPGARAVRFTSDSKAVLLVDPELRVERWDIAQRQRTWTRAAILRGSCVRVNLSPDGQFLSCLAADSNLLLVDLASGATLLDKAGFFPAAESLAFLEALGIDAPIAPMEFSPDARYFAAGFGGQVLTFDLVSRRPLSTPRSVKELLQLHFAFTAPDRLVGVLSPYAQEWEEVTFPAGKKIRTMIGGFFPLQSWSAAMSGDYIVLRPIRQYPVGVVALQSGKLVLASKESALDVYGDSYARASLDGSVSLFDIKTHQQQASTALPRHYLGPIWASAISDDLQWLAISGRGSGSVWNLINGGQVFHLRPFRSASFAPDDRLYVDFPKFENEDRVLAMLWPVNGNTMTVQKIENPATQYGRFLVVRRGKKKEEERWPMHDVDLDIHDVASNSLLWSRHFSGTMPWFNVSPQSQRLVIAWPLNSPAAKQALGSGAAMLQAASVKDRSTALVLQVLDFRNGQPIGSVLVDTGKGSFRIMGVQTAGNQVVVSDNQHRVLVYSLDGKPEQRFFGRRPVISASGALLSLENEVGSLLVFELASTKQLTELRFPSAVALSHFTSDDKNLFVLTSDQTAYLVRIPAAPLPALPTSTSK
jgi:WD40 repeat protein